jgi:hypothetical protein
MESALHYSIFLIEWYRPNLECSCATPKTLFVIVIVQIGIMPQLSSTSDKCQERRLHNMIILKGVFFFLQPRERGTMRFHMLHNIDTALHFLHCKKIKLVNIRSEDIVDGNPKLTLGLIWTIILHFQVSLAYALRFP